MTGQRPYVLTTTEHATRRARIPGTAPHWTAARVTQTIKNMARHLEDTRTKPKFVTPTATRSTPPSSTRSSPTPASEPFPRASGHHA
ncbi:hypothetical protein [Streptomyces sp. CB01635]|uniref:hypothetical protein n=1 Tax=unclassified Streptomyces TaxID=2593676 RepID=UPI001F2221D6|nr:hypothetical protein [Streptomyces sp. CB01635]